MADNEELPPEEAERRARAIARRMLNTPPQPRKKPKAALRLDRAPVSKPEKRGQAGGVS